MNAALALALVVAAAADQRLAVLDAAGAGTAQERAQWTAALRTGAASAVVDPRVSLVDAKAQKKALQRARPCKQAPAVCAVDAGKAIGATLVVVADVKKKGGKRAVAWWFVDVDSGAVLAAEETELGPKDVRAAMQARGAQVVAAGLRAKEPKKPKAPPPPPPPPPPPQEPSDTFSRTFTANLIVPEGSVGGTLTLDAKVLSFEPDARASLRAWEEVPLVEVARVEPFNHMMMLPTGLQVTTTTGRIVKLVFTDDRGRIQQLLETRAQIAKDRAAPGPAAAPNPDAGG